MAAEHDAWIERVFGVRMSEAAPSMAAPDIFGAGVMGTLVAGLPPIHAVTTQVPRAGLGHAQVERARNLALKMPPAERKQVSDLVNKAKDDERPYLIKALASGHSAAELTAFHAKVAGKPKIWVQDNLHLVGKTSGKGIKQQWASSCVPTMVEAMRGELDPIYALRTNEQNPKLTEADDSDGMRLNPKLAREQEQELGDSGSAPSSRRDAALDTSGESEAQILKHLTGVTGLKFGEKVIMSDNETVQQVLQEMKTSPKVRQALDAIQSSLKAGMPVPLNLVQIGGAPGQEGVIGGHVVLCAGYGAGPPPRYGIHDPWTGRTVVVTEADVRKGDFHTMGIGRMVLASFFQPETYK